MKRVKFNSGTSNPLWKRVIDFTRIRKGGVSMKALLFRIRSEKTYRNLR